MSVFGVSIIQDSKVLLVNLAKKTSKVVELNLANLNFAWPLNSQLIVSDDQKYLTLFDLKADPIEAEFIAKFKLPKRLTHGWVSNSKVYYWDKFGDCNSVEIQTIIDHGKKVNDYLDTKVSLKGDEASEAGEGGKEAENQGGDQGEGGANGEGQGEAHGEGGDQNAADDQAQKGINKDAPLAQYVKMEAGNFSTLTANQTITLNNGGKAIALGDQYYKVRIFDFPDLHTLRTSVAFRKRWVTSLAYIGDSLYLIFDDNQIYRVDQKEIESSGNNPEWIQKVAGVENFNPDGLSMEFLGNWGNGLTLLLGSSKVLRLGVKQQEGAEGASGKFEFVVSSEEVYGDSNILPLETGGDWESEAGLGSKNWYAVMNAEAYEVNQIVNY